MASAVCLNLDQSNILSSGNGLNFYDINEIKNQVRTQRASSHSDRFYVEIDRNTMITTALFIAFGINSDTCFLWYLEIQLSLSLTHYQIFGLGPN